MENFNDSKALAIEIAKILDKKKAHDVRVLKVESLTVLTDYFVIASGTSRRVRILLYSLENRTNPLLPSKNVLDLIIRKYDRPLYECRKAERTQT